MLLHNFLENKSNTREFTEFSRIRKSSINSSKQCTVLEKERFKKGEKKWGEVWFQFQRLELNVRCFQIF